MIVVLTIWDVVRIGLAAIVIGFVAIIVVLNRRPKR